MSTQGEITVLLARARAGEQEARSRIISLVYAMLNRMARNRMRVERAGHAFQPSDLVHEALLKMLGQRWDNLEDRKDFFVFAAVQMRRILIDHARRCNAKMHAGEHPNNKVDLDDVSLFSEQRSKELLDLDEAFGHLEKQFPLSARIVELRFFGGCSREETSEILSITVEEADREWEFAKRWLRKVLKEGSIAADKTSQPKPSGKSAKNAG